MVTCSVSIYFQLQQKKFPRIILLNISINKGSCISKCRNLSFATSRQKDEIHGFSTSHSRKPCSPFNECRGSQIHELVPDDIYIVRILHCSYHFYSSSTWQRRRSPVPALFKDRPPDYHMFLMFILFAFLGAFSALMLQHKPRVGKIFRISAIASMLSALAIVFNAAALWFVGPLLKRIN